MSSYSKLLFPAVALACVVATRAGAAEIRYVEAESAITLEGSIANGDDARFDAFLDRRPIRLIIRSEGGKQVPALAIARAVHARRMTVIVDGFCASACAQIILPAAAERRIRPDAFVAFHDGNFAVLKAVREAIVRESASLETAADPPRPDGPDDVVAAMAASRRAASLKVLRQSEAQLDEIDANQAAFNAGARLAPEVVDFYQRLTALRDVRITLQVGATQPVKVDVGRRGICDWWIPDRDSLAKLGLDLRNAYDVPTPERVAAMARTAPSRLYFGPPIAVDDPAFETLCAPP